MATQNLHFSAICVFGYFLQELTLFRESAFYSIPISKGFLDKTWVQTIIFALGISLELIAWTQLTIIQVLTLSCAHLLFFKFFHIRTQGVQMTQSEKIGTVLITISAFLVQFTSQNYENSILIDFFVIYQVSAVGMVITMRKLGFFSRKIFFEVVIPAQLMVSSMSSLKVLYNTVIETKETNSNNFLFPIVLSGFCAVSMASSFLKSFLRKHDAIVVYGAYQSWIVILPIAMTYILQIEPIGFSALGNLTVCLLSVFGNIMICFQRLEELKVVNEKRQTLTQTEFIPAEAVNLDPQNLELQIDEDNLMDTEIIDEDLLIKTIRNI